MKKILPLGLLLVQSIWAVDVKYALQVRNENTFYTDNAKIQKAEGYAKLELTIDFDDESKFVTVGRMKGDLKHHITPHAFDTSSYSHYSTPQVLGNSGIAELREFYYEKSLGDSTIKLGKMQSVWGKADGIKLLDVLNPQDFSEFILAPFDESRIPLWSLSLQHSFENSELELLWIPDNTYHTLAQGTGDYALSTSRFVPQSVEGITAKFNPVNKPDKLLKDSDIALRYTMHFEGLELSLYGLYAYDDTPILYQNLDFPNKSITINPKYERYSLFGLSMDYALGDFVYRLESAYINDKYYLNTKSSQGVTQSDSFSYIFGVDWYGLEQTILSLQINQSFLLSNKDGFSRPKVDNTLTFLYKKEIFNDTLHTEVLFIHNINDGDGLIRPKLSYELDEETLVYGRVDYFYGSKGGLYGEFSNKSRFVLGIERTF